MIWVVIVLVCLNLLVVVGALLYKCVEPWEDESPTDFDTYEDENYGREDQSSSEDA